MTTRKLGSVDYHPKPSEQGLALINVLLMVALAASLIASMLVSEAVEISRNQRLHDSAAADAILDGGELSAIAALRRDATRQPGSDDLNESWNRISDSDREIPGGKFSLIVVDAQAKFNINSVTRGDVISRGLLETILTVLHLDVDVAKRIELFLAMSGPITSLEQLSYANIDSKQISALAKLCTVLPPMVSKINVNTADEIMLGALLGNRIAGRLISNQRARHGFLTTDDFMRARVLVPTGVAFSSDYYWVRGQVSIGGTSRQLTTLLRRQLQLGRPELVAVSRWVGGGAPLEAPATP